MKHPRVSIIILNWNGLKDTIDCLESLQQVTHPNYEVIVVDNGSEGKDVEVLRDRFGNYIYIIQNDKNYGFAEGNNIGARYALENLDPDYLLLLNNDTVVDPHFLTELVDVAESDPKIGIVGGKVYFYGTNIFDSAGSILTNIGSGKSRGHLEEDKGQYDSEEEVPLITACCLLARKQVVESTHLFDPSFFVYLEELDFAIRVRRLGYKIVYVPRSIIYHKFSQSVQRAHSETVLFKQFHAQVNRGRILARYYPLKILLRNWHLILLSYLYDEYYFLRWGGISWFVKLNYHLLRSLLPACKDRLHYRDRGESGWTNWITCYSFKEYRQLRQQMERRYHYK